MSYDQPPAGYRWEWMPDQAWKVGGDGRNCRMRGCRATAVAALSRKHGNGWVSWYYCESHLYGRKLEDGVIKSRRLVKEELSA